ncbi:MAG: S41 family peptidase [Bacteroidota bacterium]
MSGSEKKSNRNYRWPLLFSVVLCFGIYIGTRLQVPSGAGSSFFTLSPSGFDKISDIITYIEQEYVDTVDKEKLMDLSIEKMLQSLDPHSSYITAADLNAANEPLEGNFEGIGVEFHIQDDTIMVVSAISGGPSEAVGIRSGDRIVEVNDTLVAGIGINNNDVMRKLRGQGGTKVRVKVFRRGAPKLLSFTITRGKIPIYSLDAAFMADAKTGYIRVSRFAATTYDEFMQAAEKLASKGMSKMIIDLRGNPGGYLDAATKIADEFISEGKSIVYTEGKSRPRADYDATGGGKYESLPVVVLIDEGSASASEILAGALQDWDRATIIGRRSFGKGLVQEQTVLPDGSAIRLTIARYYTPTGRSIQKPYKDGYDQYNNELNERYAHQELLSLDSIKFLDSLKYTTPKGKVVYGGGGIMPDVFVPIDTTDSSNPFFNLALSGGGLTDFAYDYVDKNRLELSRFKDVESFKSKFQVSEVVYSSFVRKVTSNVSKMPDVREIANASAYIKNLLKANIARQLFGGEGFYPIWLTSDPLYNEAINVISKVGK